MQACTQSDLSTYTMYEQMISFVITFNCLLLLLIYVVN